MLSKLSKVKLIILMLFVCLSFYSFAAGQKDLSKKPPGYGVLVIGNEGRFTSSYCRWTYKMIFTNSKDKKEYEIEIPVLNKSIQFYYFPPGNYHIEKIIQRHYDGQQFIPNNGIPLQVYNRLNFSFTIKEGHISFFPYYLYKFNNKPTPNQSQTLLKKSRKQPRRPPLGTT